ncbi:hypothetical protein X801_07205, partial [Opisthorchis viverrini]
MYWEVRNEESCAGSSISFPVKRSGLASKNLDAQVPFIPGQPNDPLTRDVTDTSPSHAQLAVRPTDSHITATIEFLGNAKEVSTEAQPQAHRSSKREKRRLSRHKRRRSYSSHSSVSPAHRSRGRAVPEDEDHREYPVDARRQSFSHDSISSRSSDNESQYSTASSHSGSWRRHRRRHRRRSKSYTSRSSSRGSSNLSRGYRDRTKSRSRSGRRRRRRVRSSYRRSRRRSYSSRSHSRSRSWRTSESSSYRSSRSSSRASSPVSHRRSSALRRSSSRPSPVHRKLVSSSKLSSGERSRSPENRLARLGMGPLGRGSNVEQRVSDALTTSFSLSSVADTVSAAVKRVTGGNSISVKLEGAPLISPLALGMDGQAGRSPVFYGTQPSPALSFNHWVEHTNAQPPSPDLFSDTAVDEEFWTSNQPNPSQADTIPVPETPPAQYRPTPLLDLSNVWHSKRRQLFSPEPSIQDNNKLWTFVYRGQPPRFERNTRASCLYVDHGDHYHFVFECCPQNKTRTIQRLIDSGNLDRSQTMSIMATVQPVINWNHFAAYLVRAAQTPIICIGKKLEHLRDDLYMIPREKKDCATLLRDERSSRQKHNNITRKRRLDLMRELVRTYDARSFNELYKRLSVQDTDDIYAEYGPTWKETAEHSIANYCKEIILEQETMTFEQILTSNHHSRTCQHPADTLAGEDWLDQLIRVNNINKRELLVSLTAVMSKLCTRKNAFVIEGPTTTGKTLFVKLVAENYVYGTVQRSGDHSQFFLMNLLNKTLALMEEPRITQLTVNDFKELLGGNAFDIHVKHQKDERLERLPVLITTNNPLTYYVMDADGKAILGTTLLFQISC